MVLAFFSSVLVKTVLREFLFIANHGSRQIDLIRQIGVPRHRVCGKGEGCFRSLQWSPQDSLHQRISTWISTNCGR